MRDEVYTSSRCPDNIANLCEPFPFPETSYGPHFFMKCQLHLFLPFRLFLMFNQLLASCPASYRNAYCFLHFLSLFFLLFIFFSRALNFNLTQRTLQRYFFSKKLSRRLNYWIILNYCFLNLNFMSWLHLLFGKIDTSLVKNEYLDSKSLSKYYMIIVLIGM